MFTHMLKCLLLYVCVSGYATICVCVCVYVFVLMSFVFLEQTLIVFDFSKDSSDACSLDDT